MFKFNYNNETSPGSGDNKRKHDEGAVDAESHLPVPEAPAKEHFLDEMHLEQLGEDAVIKELAVGDGEVILYLDSDSVSLDIQRSSMDAEDAVGRALNNKSDLVPGVYEGGLKIWECSYDLVNYLSRSVQALKGLQVLELGCGAGLPGLYAFKHGASVDFQDYNTDVIERLTIPNVLINAPVSEPEAPESRFFSGDWMSFQALIGARGNKYDLILTTETIYNIRNHPKLMAIFKSCLKPEGKVLLGAKVHYFGVGGGLRQFEESLIKTGLWQFQTVNKADHTVKREVIEIQHKP